jgi:hypothetical protein
MARKVKTVGDLPPGTELGHLPMYPWEAALEGIKEAPEIIKSIPKGEAALTAEESARFLRLLRGWVLQAMAVKHPGFTDLEAWLMNTWAYWLIKGGWGRE